MYNTTAQQTLSEILKTSQGKIFSLEFIKKDGSRRTMSCRLNVRKDLKGTGMKYDVFKHGILTVYDMNKKGYRSVKLDSIQKLSVNGLTFDVNKMVF